VTSRAERLAHLFPKGITTPRLFTAPGSPRDPNRLPAFPQRADPAAHARHLLDHITAAGATRPALDAERKKALLDDCEGMFVDIEFIPTEDFSLQSLEDKTAGIETGHRC
jgi:hypothetical protein